MRDHSIAVNYSGVSISTNIIYTTVFVLIWTIKTVCNSWICRSCTEESYERSNLKRRKYLNVEIFYFFFCHEIIMSWKFYFKVWLALPTDLFNKFSEKISNNNWTIWSVNKQIKVFKNHLNYFLKLKIFILLLLENANFLYTKLCQSKPM